MQEVGNAIPSCRLAGARYRRVITSLLSPSNNEQPDECCYARTLEPWTDIGTGKAIKKGLHCDYDTLMVDSSHIITNTCICNLQGSSHGSHSAILVICFALLYSWCLTLHSAARHSSARDLSLRQAECSPKHKKSKEVQGIDREAGALPILNQRIGTSQQNKHHAALPNPTAANAPRPSTTARQSQISMEPPSKHPYTLACIALHCISFSRQVRDVRQDLPCTTNNKTRANRDPPQNVGDLFNLSQ
jgi:hypothetical protein